jgi:hypothetical protein
MTEAPVYSTPFSRNRFSCGRRLQTCFWPMNWRCLYRPIARPCNSQSRAQSDELIMASPVQRKRFDFALGDDPGDLLAREVHRARRRFHGESLPQFAHRVCEVDHDRLAEHHSIPVLRSEVEALPADGHLIAANRDRRSRVAAVPVGRELALCARPDVLNGYSRPGQGRARVVTRGAGNGVSSCWLNSSVATANR